MNPSVNDPDEGMTDRLLFEYLEGELSPGQAKALEDRLAADPALRGELELWQASFVQPDEYDTQALEKCLVQEHVPVPGSWAAGWLPGLVLMLVLAWFLLAPPAADKEPPAARERVAATAPAGNSSPVEEAAEKEQVVTVLAPQAIDIQEYMGEKPLPARTVREAHFLQNERTEAIRMPELRPLTPVPAPENLPVAVDLAARQVKVRPVPVKKAALPKALLRKQERAIARMKERARQQRKANEFLKGNVPYVVPLNSNSF